MLVRQRTANPNPLLSSPPDNASSTPSTPPPPYRTPPRDPAPHPTLHAHAPIRHCAIKIFYATFFICNFSDQLRVSARFCAHAKRQQFAFNKKEKKRSSSFQDLVGSQCKFVSSLISPDMRCVWVCERCVCVSVRDVINIKSQRVHCWCVMCSPGASEGSYDLLACECIIFSVRRSSDSRQATRASLWMPIAQSLSYEMCYRARNHEASSGSCVLRCCS